MPPIPKSVAVISAGVFIGAIAVPVVILLAGFSTGGVVTGSMAAGIQSGIGNVAAGSTFAAMQSIGTMPFTSMLYGGILGGVVVGGYVTIPKHPDFFRDIGRHIAAAGGELWKNIKSLQSVIPSVFRVVEKRIESILKSIMGKIDGSTLANSIQSTVGSVSGAFADVGKMLRGLATPDMTTKGWTSMIETLNSTSAAHHAIENVGGVVGDAKSAIGRGVGKLASNIFN